MRTRFVFAVLGVYLFCLVSIGLKNTVGMRNDGLSPIGLVRELMTLKQTEIGEFISSLGFIAFTAVVIISIIPFLTAKLRRFQLHASVFALGCLVVPTIFQIIIGEEAPSVILALIVCPIFAPLITLGMLVGGLDGEFYNEGFLIFAAIGWWEIVWIWALIKDLVRRKMETIAGG